MNLECSVELFRYNQSLPTDDLTVNSEFPKNIDVDNKEIDVKRSERPSRKRTYQDKLNSEDDQSDNVKKKKCVVKKLQFSKTETEKLETSPNSKKTKHEVTTTENSPKNNANNSDVHSGSISFIDTSETNETITVAKSSSNTPKKKLSPRLNTSNEKKSLANNINKDAIPHKIEKKSNSSSSSKSSKHKTSKSTTHFKVKFVANNPKKKDKSKELKNKDLVSLKSPSRKAYSKTISSVVNNVLQSNELESSSDLGSLKPKNKTSNKLITPTKKIVVHKGDSSIALEPSNDLVVSKTPKKQSRTSSKSINSIEKSSDIISVNKHNTSDKLQESVDTAVTRKRGRSTQKKIQLQKNIDLVNSCSNTIDLQQAKNVAIVLEKIPMSALPSKFVDNTMMLRSNNKPPKIKKKWSDEWSVSKLSNSVLKPNVDDHLSNSKEEINNSNKTLKKILKVQKSKSSNYKKIKTQMLEKMTINTTEPESVINSSTCGNTMKETVDNIKSVMESICAALVPSAPLVHPSAVNNDTITEPVDTNTHNSNEPRSTESVISFGVTTVSSMPMTDDVVNNEKDPPSPLISFKTVPITSYLMDPMVPESEISYGMDILSEAISRQCKESMNNSIQRNLPEQDLNKVSSPPKKSNCSPQPQLPNAVAPPQKPINTSRANKTTSKKAGKNSSGFCKKIVETELQVRLDNEINLLSKRFNIPIESLKKLVVDEPLSVFQTKYPNLVSSSLVKVSPIVKNVEAKSKDYISGNLDVEYKIDPIRESSAYEKTNLQDLMTELSKTMPSWSLSIVSNPSRYVLSHMSINKNGIPFANKSIVLDRNFRASVYINQSLKQSYSKRYTTPTEIVNLIKELNSI